MCIESYARGLSLISVSSLPIAGLKCLPSKAAESAPPCHIASVGILSPRKETSQLRNWQYARCYVAPRLPLDVWIDVPRRREIGICAFLIAWYRTMSGPAYPRCFALVGRRSFSSKGGSSLKKIVTGRNSLDGNTS